MPQIQRGEAPKFSLSLYLICEPLDLAAASWLVTCGGQECLSLLSRSLTGMLNKQGLMSVPAVPHQTPPQTRSLPTCCYLLFNFPGSPATNLRGCISPGSPEGQCGTGLGAALPPLGQAELFPAAGGALMLPVDAGCCVHGNETRCVHPALWSAWCRHVGSTLEISSCSPGKSLGSCRSTGSGRNLELAA